MDRRRSRIAAAAVWVLAALAGSSSAVAQPPVPPNEGWVTDLADMLEPDEEAALEALMESYRAGSGHEIALLTVPELGGQPIERFALEVARAWGLGRADVHDGALLVVAKAERKLRIEVGRGLEGTLTDAISGRIIRDVIAPELRSGGPYRALRAGVEAIHAAAGGEYGEVEPAQDRDRHFIGLFPLLFLFILFLTRGARRGRRGRRRPVSSDLLSSLLLGTLLGGGGRGGSHGYRSSGSSGGFGGFGGGGGFSGGGASGGW